MGGCHNKEAQKDHTINRIYSRRDDGEIDVCSYIHENKNKNMRNYKYRGCFSCL